MKLKELFESMKSDDVIITDYLKKHKIKYSTKPDMPTWFYIDGTDIIISYWRGSFTIQSDKFGYNFSNSDEQYIFNKLQTLLKKVK